jgi:hypothetical protein
MRPSAGGITRKETEPAALAEAVSGSGNAEPSVKPFRKVLPIRFLSVARQ